MKRTFKERNLDGEWQLVATSEKCRLYNCETDSEYSVITHHSTDDVIAIKRKMTPEQFYKWAEGIDNIVSVQDFNEELKTINKMKGV